MEGALLGLGLSAIVSGWARWKRILTWDGAIAAVAVGTAIFAFGGWRWAAVLLLFFTSSTFWTWNADLLSGRRESQHGRTAGQVMANGGIPAVAALAYGLGLPFALPAFLGSIAAATADTWATEIGLLSPVRPRLITTGQSVEPGRSGGITPVGTGAGGLGALTIALSTFLLQPSPSLALATFLAGGTAMLLDSLLGATIQERYRCATCGKEGEDPICCQTRAERIGGLRRITNSVVNVLASAWGAIVGITFAALL